MNGSPPLMNPRRWVFAVIVLLVASSAFAQVQTGNIFGKVQTTDGSVLPGVTVTLTGVGAPQTFVTEAQGSFRFLNLSPGTYALHAELAGMGQSNRKGIGVNIGRNSDVTLTLSPSVEQSITVTAEAPLLDVRKTGTGSTISHVELDKVPTGRDPWVILQQTPGVLIDRNNVGGNESGQQSSYVSKGTVGSQSTWNVDGVNITDFGATGSSPTYYDFDVFDEMQFTTGGTDPRIMTPGVQINMVTKRGTNDFKGSARAFHTSSSYQATPSIPAEAKSYLKTVNQISKIDDDGAEFGGPILRDRLWIWGAYGKQKIDNLVASSLAVRPHDKTELKNENLKLNAQLFPSNSLTLVDQYGAKIKLGRNVGPTRAPETGWNQNDSYAHGVGSLTDPTLWKIEDTQLFGQNLYLTGLYSKVQGGFQLISDNGKGCQSFACGASGPVAYRDLAGDGSWHRSYLTYKSVRPQKQYRLDGSAFVNTGSISHELKFGYGYRDAGVTSSTAWPGDQYTYNYGGGVGDGNDTGFVALMRIPTFTYSAKSTDAYIGDTVMMGNLTVQAGLRYDLQKGSNSSGTGAANSVVPDLLPAYTFPATGTLKFNNISPRLGLTYAMGAERRTLLRAAYSRYVDQLSSGTVAPISPGSAAYTYYYFNDLNHDNVAQRNEIDFNYGSFFHRGFDPAHPTASSSVRRWASNLKAPRTDEIILGAEREVLTDLSIGADLTFRKLDNFIESVFEHTQGQGDYYSSADYVLGPPVTATLPNGQTTTLNYYQLKPGVKPGNFSVYRNRPDYHQTYKGLELNATKRMSNRWMLRGAFTFQDWTQSAGPGGIIDPTRTRLCGTCSSSPVVIGSGTGSGAKGGIYINSKWSTSITGVYQIPVVETALGFNLNSRQGYALPYVWSVRPSGTGEGTKLLLAPSSVDTFRNPTVTQLDLRLAKEIRFKAVGLTLSIDGFNVLNANTVLQRNVTQLNSAPNSTKPLASANRITEVLSPRVFRLGARFTF